jgi:dihydroflavonol-4-reductase
MIVVTGAGGHVGNVLLRQLVALGAGPVRGTLRPGGSTKATVGLDVEVIEADVRDNESLLRAFQGADVVFHTAGIVSITRGGSKRLKETNVDGTRNVLAACRKAGVGRLVYTSSVHAFAEPPPGTCLDEAQTIDPSRAIGAYARTKAEATLLVLDAAADGFDAVVVYPSAIRGHHDFRPSHTGALIAACSRGALKAFVPGAYNFVDVRDVAHGLVAAAEKGRRGEGYIVAGNEITVSELLHALARATGAPPPRWQVPFGLVRSLSFLFPAYYWATRQRPLFTTYSLNVIASNCSMSSEKAHRELGFSPRALRETIQDTVRWFTEQGML